MQLNASTAKCQSAGNLPKHVYGSFMKDNELWQAQDVDTIQIAKGFSWYPLISHGDVINSKNDRFGDCCDFITLLPHPSGKAQSALMWVNHESVTTAALYGKKVEANQKSLNMVEAEMKLVGGSLLELAHDGSRWQVNASSNLAFRIDSFSKIPLTGPISREVVGTAGNCSGGVTPWHTILSCEENPENF